MPKSAFDYTQNVSSGQPWTWTWTPGTSLANFFSLYNYHSLADANGDLTTSGATSIATTLDGPIQVAKFRNLTVNHAVTPSQRNRGLMPIADTLTMGASGSISMTGFGAAGSPKWVVGRDIFVPQSITFTGKNTSLKQFLDWIRSTGYCIFDPNLYIERFPGMGDVQCDWATWTPYGSTIISSAGCGAAGAKASNGGAGGAGGAGSSAPGGGGGGTALGYESSGWGSSGKVWSGGNPGQSGGSASHDADPYSAAGAGGILWIIVRGNATIASGGTLTANANTGGYGGGFVLLAYLGTLSNSGSMAANGSSGSGGTGGTGYAQAKSFATIGW